MRRSLIAMLLILLVASGCTIDAWRSPATRDGTNGCKTPDGTLIPAKTHPGVTKSAWQWNGCHTGVLIHIYIHHQPTKSADLRFFIDVANPAEGGSLVSEGAYQRLNDQNFFHITNTTNLGNRQHFMLMYYPGANDESNKGHLLIQPVAVPRRWRVRVVTSGDEPWAYSVGYSMLK